MNKLTKLMLASAVLATSGFAGGGTTPVMNIDGTEIIDAGGKFKISTSDYVVSSTGKIQLNDSAEEGKGAVLEIDSGRSMTLSGGELSYSGSNTYKPKVVVNGTLTLAKDSSDKMPTMKLKGVAVEGVGGEIRQWVDGITLTMNTQFDNTEINGQTYEVWGDSGRAATAIVCGDYALSYKGSGEAPDDATEWDEDGTFLVKGDVLYADGGCYEFSKIIKTNLPGGNVDMVGLRAADVSGELGTVDLSSNIDGFAPTALGSVKLPFNCKFANVNLSNVDSVEYTKVVKEASSAVKVIENLITKEETSAETYGDYAGNASGYGLTLPSESSKIKVTESKIAGSTAELNLSDVQANDTLNVVANKLNTTLMNSGAHAIAADTTYYFGFSGTGAIAISASGVYKAIFAGDNSDYGPGSAITLPDNVVFAGSTSLFPFDHTYKNVAFAAGTASATLTNEVPAGKTVTTGSFSIGANHTLTVKGTLIG